MSKRKALIPFGQNDATSIDYLLGILADARITTLEKMAKELNIPKEHSMNKTLWEFIFYNHFRFWMLLFIIFFTGMALYVALI